MKRDNMLALFSHTNRCFTAAPNRHEVGTLALDGRIVTFGTVQREGTECDAHNTVPSSLYQNETTPCQAPVNEK